MSLPRGARRWTAALVLDEIRRLQAKGEDMSYTGSRKRHLALHRAAGRRYGSWRAAVEAAGMDYGALRRRSAWDPNRVRLCVRELADQHADLSVTGMAARGRRDVLAAAERAGGWPGVLESIGVAYRDVCRKRRWDVAAICSRISELAADGCALNAGAVEAVDAGLVAAARRIVGSWPDALRLAGYDPACHVLRRGRQ